MKQVITLVFLFSISVVASAQQANVKSDGNRMKTFIDALMTKMTIDEKIGQLNLPGSGDIVRARLLILISAKKYGMEKLGGFLISKQLRK
jgi:beta-glucosidase